MNTEKTWFLSRDTNINEKNLFGFFLSPDFSGKNPAAKPNSLKDIGIVSDYNTQTKQIFYSQFGQLLLNGRLTFSEWVIWLLSKRSASNNGKLKPFVILSTFMSKAIGLGKYDLTKEELKSLLLIDSYEEITDDFVIDPPHNNSEWNYIDIWYNALPHTGLFEESNKKDVLIIRNNPFAKEFLKLYSKLGRNTLETPLKDTNREKYYLFMQDISTGIIEIISQFPQHIQNVIVPNLSQLSLHHAVQYDHHHKQNKSLSYLLSAIRTKPFLLLAGISGTGKSRVVRKLAQATVPYSLQKDEMTGLDELSFDSDGRWKIHTPANFQIIQVKPNWHSSMDVVGYETSIPTPHYVFTPFVEFIVKAWMHPSVPFFLCIDEMNLAPVEEFFAEYLSAIESSSKKDGVYKTDPIIKKFNSFGNEVCNQMIHNLFKGVDFNNTTPELRSLRDHFEEVGLTLPENLIVFGTVNMDDTTCSFSRKVLDRAMSIELNEVDFDRFLSGDTEIVSTALTESKSNKLITRPINGKTVNSKEDAIIVMEYLKAVNTVLDGTPFKLGYRAANEALLYVSASRDFEQGNVRVALDEFTLMKILSRIEGDSSKLQLDAEDNSSRDTSLLEKLKTVIEKHLMWTDDPVEEATEEAPQNDTPENVPVSEVGAPPAQNEADESTPPQEPRKLKSVEKLERMMNQLKRNGFVSYWE